MIFYCCQNIVKVIFIVDEIEIVAFDNKQRTEFIPLNPILIQCIQRLKIGALNTLFEITPAL